MQKKVKVFVTLVLPLFIVMVAAMESGCRHNTNSTTPVSPQVATAVTLLDASNTCVTVEDGLTAADHAIDQLKASDPEYYAKVSPLIKKISAANVVAAQKIQVVKNTGQGDWKSAMLAVAQSVNVNDLNAAQVKNPTSQGIVTAALASLVAILNTINQNFGGTK